MTKEQNGRLRIRQCLQCSKICRGSEWKKHKVETSHTRSWRRLFCSAHEPIKQAHSLSKAFIKRHGKCQKHKPISNSAFRQYICDTRRILGDRHNLSPAEDSDLSSEYETEAENDPKANMNTEGESEGEISSISEGDSDFTSDRLRQVPKEKEGEDGEKEPTTDSAQPESTSQPEATPQSEPKAPPKAPGIKQQAKLWTKEMQLQAISREAHLENVYNKYISLQKQHKVLSEEHQKIKMAAELSKVSRDEIEMAKMSAREKSKQVANLMAKLDIANAKLLEQQAALEESEAEKRQAREGEKRARQALDEHQTNQMKKDMEASFHDTQRFEIHLPHVQGDVKDEILVYDLDEDTDEECYRGSNNDVQCMHLLLTRRGRKISIKQRNTKKRFCRNLDNPPTQRPRHE